MLSLIATFSLALSADPAPLYQVQADLASADGALIVDRTGRLMAYGAMVRSSSSTSTQGARSRAAVAASRLGLAMVISADGGISVYRHGRPVVSL